jgi:hypothetical protein
MISEAKRGWLVRVQTSWRRRSSRSSLATVASVVRTVARGISRWMPRMSEIGASGRELTGGTEVAQEASNAAAARSSTRCSVVLVIYFTEARMTFE